MTDPFKAIRDMQMAMVEAWFSMARHGFDAWAHGVELQHHFLERTMEHHRNHIEIARGPSLTDHYGKRSHDIDPERDL